MTYVKYLSSIGTRLRSDMYRGQGDGLPFKFKGSDSPELRAKKIEANLDYIRLYMKHGPVYNIFCTGRSVDSVLAKSRADVFAETKKVDTYKKFCTVAANAEFMIYREGIEYLQMLSDLNRPYLRRLVSECCSDREAQWTVLDVTNKHVRASGVSILRTFTPYIAEFAFLRVKEGFNDDSQLLQDLL